MKAKLFEEFAKEFIIEGDLLRGLLAKTFLEKGEFPIKFIESRVAGLAIPSLSSNALIC